MRKAKYDLDEAQVKPYFELNNVLQNGVFYAANQLYGITFKERKDIPVYQPDVRVFEVFDADGKPLALWYCDYFKRDNKNGGAWMNKFVDQSKLLGTLPVVYNVANFTKPAPGEPALISFRRRDHHVPRIRPRPARHVRRHRVSDAFRHRRGARLRRVPVAVQRALGELSGGVRALREALQDRRADARGARRQDQEGRDVQSGLRAHRGAGRRGTRHAVAHASGRARRCRIRMRSKQQALEKTKLSLSYVPPRYRSSYFPAHLGQRLRGRLLRLSVERDAGRRCLSSGSRITAA